VHWGEIGHRGLDLGQLLLAKFRSIGTGMGCGPQKLKKFQSITARKDIFLARFSLPSFPSSSLPVPKSS